MDGYLSACVVRCGADPRASVAVDTWRVSGCGACSARDTREAAALCFALPPDAAHASQERTSARTRTQTTPSACPVRAARGQCGALSADAVRADAWCEGPILCSEATKTLLLLKWPSLASRITALQYGETVRAACACVRGHKTVG